MPALLPLIGSQHIFIQADDVEAGNRLLQTLLLRMVMASRPAAVRLDLTDPIGGGSTVGSLLHLPATLRTPRAATRPQEIETLLDDLVTHIETVVQTRLLSTYITVEAYNADQPELAVPYRLLRAAQLPSRTDRARLATAPVHSSEWATLGRLHHRRVRSVPAAAAQEDGRDRGPAGEHIATPERRTPNLARPGLRGADCDSRRRAGSRSDQPLGRRHAAHAGAGRYPRALRSRQYPQDTPLAGRRHR